MQTPKMFIRLQIELEIALFSKLKYFKCNALIKPRYDVPFLLGYGYI